MNRLICIHWMDNFFEAHGEFITLEMTDRINADSLISVIKGVLKGHLKRTSLSLRKLRGLTEAKTTIFAMQKKLLSLQALSLQA